MVIGIILLVTVIRGNQNELVELLKSDFSGQGNFIIWVLVFVVLVALGNWKTIRPITDAFIGLIIVVIFLAAYRDRKDLFSSFVSQLKEGTS